MARITCVTVLLAARLLFAAGTCPHLQQGLQSFSDIAADYKKSSIVTIEKPTLLDVELVNVTQVIVEKSGSLVFNRGHDITIWTEGIMVRGDASLVIGSQECPHLDQVNIYLEGIRTTDRESLGPEGDKFIMVTENGSLQIFGQEKLPWTKLNGTVERFEEDSSNVIFRHLDSDEADDYASWIGLAFSIFNTDLERRVFRKFNYKHGKVYGAMKHIRWTRELLDTVKAGELVAVSVSSRFEYNDGCNITDLFDALEKAAGMPANSLALRTSTNRYDAWSMVFVSGGSYDQALDAQLGKVWCRAVSAIEHKGYKVSSVSAVRYSQKHNSFQDVIILNPEAGYPEINVIDDVTSWNVGDEVLLTSTDYAWDHAEVRRIKKIEGTNKVVLDGELYYRHFGEIENRVDMRGEVALLTRNIKIQGVMSPDCPAENKYFCNIGYDTYGGHIKVHESFGSVQIEGVELQFMGQTSDRGFYPLHFHMCKNITGFYPLHFHMCKNITGKTAILRRNSIHHTFRRAITVHGTYGTSETQLGVQVIENVAYDVLGHAFFLEDGAEMATLLQGNLGATVRRANTDVVTDIARPAVFWITNPKVIMVDNVASGSQSMGIWYTFPREPVGPSDGLVYSRLEAKHTALWRFDNNVVHSNAENGMFFDNILDNDNGKVVGCMEYEARVNPLDSESPWAKVQLVRLTAYKNVKVNCWLRGGYFEVIQYSSAESKRGIHIARGSEQQMFVKKSMIVGQSERNHEYLGYPDAQNGESLGQYIGAVIHDGPTYYDSCWFSGFQPGFNGSFKAGAVGFSTESKFTSSVVSRLTNLKFGFQDAVGGNRLFDGDVDTSVEGTGDFDSAETATLRDGDGSVTSCPESSGDDFKWSEPTQLVVPQKFALTEDCMYRENWNLAACNNKYGKLKMTIKEVWGNGYWSDFPRLGQMKRHELLSSETAVEDAWPKKPTTEYLVILGSDKYYYSFQFIKDFPKKFRVDARGVERDYGVTAGLCMPEGAVYGEHYTIVMMDANAMYVNDLVFVDTIDDVMNDITMSRVYVEGRFIYFRLHTNRERDPAWNRQDSDQCAGRRCPKAIVYMLKEMTYTPCFTPTDDELSNTAIMNTIKRHDCILPQSGPEDDWGAGDTKTASRDGNWGTWSSWSECCNSVNSTETTSRYRVCDNPPPYGSGAQCAGDEVQTKQCEQGCPVDGVMGEWSSWSECFCDGIGEGTYGMRSRQRECLYRANGGKGCEGQTVGMYKCMGDCGYFFNSGLPAERNYDDN